MRKFLLATSAAALALTFSGPAFAELPKIPVSATVAPPEATTADGLVFSKDALQAQPTDTATQAQPSDQAKPAEAASPAGEATSPAGEAAKRAEQAAPAIAADSGPIAQPLKDLVENKLQQFVPKEQDRAGVLAFYRARNFTPLWLEGSKPAPRVTQAAAFLKGVAADGLDPTDYPAPAFASADPAQLAADELALTNSVVTFARHASIGRVAFSRVSGAVYFEQKAPNPADVLAKVAESADLRATLDAFNPQVPAYKALKAELAAVRSGKDAQPEVKAASKEAKEESGKKSKKKKSAKADEPKAPEVKSKAAKIDAIVANMERWRWMPHELGATYVMVNVPDYTLKVVQNGKTVWTTKIVAGKPGGHATPLLTETMKYITVNPTWNVPPSIIRNEYLPALARDPGALSRVGLQVSHNKDGSIRIFQPPGERNALGRIRFNFPNRFLVYQHDTPDKKLFDHTARAYSHGCMRVQNPDQYAEVLLKVSQPEDNYTAAKIRSMYGSSERTINLKKQIPVYITYQTAFVDDAGKLQSRADVYGLDKETLGVLHGDARVADVPVPRNYSSSSKPVMSSAATGRGRDISEARQSYGWDSRQSNGWDSGRDYQPSTRSAYQPPDRSRVW